MMIDYCTVWSSLKFYSWSRQGIKMYHKTIFHTFKVQIKGNFLVLTVSSAIHGLKNEPFFGVFEEYV